MKNLVARCFLILSAVGGLTAALVTGCGGSNGDRPTGVGGSNMGAGGGGGVIVGTGTGGAGGDCTISACPATGTLSCTTPVTPQPLVTDFSACYWHNTAGKFGLCPLTGSIYHYQGDTAIPDGGVASSATSTVDYMTAQNYQFTATVTAAGYAGAGLQFDACATLANYTGIQFTLLGTSGGCALELQFATFDQRPTDLNPPGGCDRPGGASCFGYPVAKAIATPTDSTVPITVNVPFSTVSNWSAAEAAQVIGLQWQLTSPPPAADGGSQASCTADLRIDDITFTTN